LSVNDGFTIFRHFGFAAAEDGRAPLNGYSPFGGEEEVFVRWLSDGINLFIVS
jgi:hypothetical protein